MKTGTGDCVVEATAGSGKTSTLVEVANQLHTDNAIFLAFNKHIVEELQSRLPEKMAVKTIHSVGFGALMRTGKKFKSPSDNKYKKICKEVAADITFKNPSLDIDPFAITKQLQIVCNFVRLTLTNYNSQNALWDMIDHFGLEVPASMVVGTATGRHNDGNKTKCISHLLKLGVLDPETNFALQLQVAQHIDGEYLKLLSQTKEALDKQAETAFS